MNSPFHCNVVKKARMSSLFVFLRRRSRIQGGALSGSYFFFQFHGNFQEILNKSQFWFWDVCAAKFSLYILRLNFFSSGGTLKQAPRSLVHLSEKTAMKAPMPVVTNTRSTHHIFTVRHFRKTVWKTLLTATECNMVVAVSTEICRS